MTERQFEMLPDKYKTTYSVPTQKHDCPMKNQQLLNKVAYQLAMDTCEVSLEQVRKEYNVQMECDRIAYIIKQNKLLRRIISELDWTESITNK